MRDLSYPEDIRKSILGIFGACSRNAITVPLKQKGQQILQVAGIPIAPSGVLKTEILLNPDVAQFNWEEQFITALSCKLRETRERREGFLGWSWTGWAKPIHVQPRSNIAGCITDTHGLSLQFGATWELTNGKRSGGLDTMLAIMQKKWLPANYIQTVVATGECVMVDVHDNDNSSIEVRPDWAMEYSTGITSISAAGKWEVMEADDLHHQISSSLASSLVSCKLRKLWIVSKSLMKDYSPWWSWSCGEE